MRMAAWFTILAAVPVVTMNYCLHWPVVHRFRRGLKALYYGQSNIEQSGDQVKGKPLINNFTDLSTNLKRDECRLSPCQITYSQHKLSCCTIYDSTNYGIDDGGDDSGDDRARSDKNIKLKFVPVAHEVMPRPSKSRQQFRKATMLSGAQK